MSWVLYVIIISATSHSVSFERFVNEGYCNKAIREMHTTLERMKRPATHIAIGCIKGGEGFPY